MSKKLFSKGKGQFLTSFLSYYIIILCIPLMVGIGLYFYSSNVIQDEVTKANKVVIEQLKLTIDHRLYSVRDFTMQLGADENIESIMYVHNELSTSNRYTLIYLVDNFIAYNVSNDFIEDFFIYFNNSNTIIGPNGYTSIKGMNDNSFYENTWYFPKWTQILQQAYRGQLYPVFLENTDTIESVIYLQSLPVAVFNEPEAIVVMKLNTAYFNDLMGSVTETSSGQATFAIIDEDENIIYSYGKRDLVPELANMDLGDKSEGFVSISKRYDHYVYVSKSDVANWRYLTIIPSQVFNRRVTGARNIALASLLLIIFLSLFAIMYVKRKRYDPLAATIDLLKNDEKAQGTDAFAYLQSTVARTLSEKLSMEENMLHNRDYLQSYFLMRLVSQRIDDQDAYGPLIDYYGIDLNHAYTSVVIFYLNTQDDRSIRENVEFVNFLEAIKETFKETFITEEEVLASLYPVYFNGMLVCLINYSELIQLDNGIVHWLNGFKESLQSIDVSVAVSRGKKSIEEISTAYDEALQALERKLVYGKSGVSQYSASQTGKKITQIKYYQYENNFTTLMDNGEYDKAKNVIKNLFNLVLNQEHMNINIVKCRMFGIINILMNTVEKLNLPADLISFDELYAKLVGFYSIEELSGEILRTLEVIKVYMNKDSFGKGSIIDQVVKFIETHYNDPNLSVSQLADDFHMDMSILSRKFKKEQQINLSDYIHLKRLDAGKRMIVESKETIKSIAIQCGYLNSDVFIRVFKRYEGMTPGKFRQNNK